LYTLEEIEHITSQLQARQEAEERDQGQGSREQKNHVEAHVMVPLGHQGRDPTARMV
jgi:hypothetical protein